MSKLSDEKVLDIRRHLARGMTAQSLARKYKVAPQSIDAIAAGLAWGWLTSEDELQDAIDSARDRRGAAHPRAKLNETIVRQIRQLGATRMPRVAIADKFGVGLPCVESVLYGRTWKHVR